MTSARFSNPFKFFCAIASVTVLGVGMPQHAHAQDPNYAPPPMFDDMTPPMVRPEGQDGYLVSPKASTNTPITDQTPGRTPVIVPRVSVDPDAPRPAVAAPAKPAPSSAPSLPPAAPVVPAVPVAPAAPVAPAPVPKMKPIVEETYIKREAPAKKPVSPKKQNDEPRTESLRKADPAPVASPSKPVAPKAPDAPVADTKTEPAKRDPHVSVIKGPKTMPALPAGDVEQQVTFENAPETPETIMERHRREAEAKREGKETLTPIVPAPNPDVAPAAFDRGGQDVLKKVIPFQQGQISLPSSEADPIVAGVVREMDREEMKDWRVQIKAYATPHGTGLSSDRRIALSRALSLRSTMITQGVPAAKIDVLAEGLQSEGGAPPDRIDLYLYGPKSK